MKPQEYMDLPFAGMAEDELRKRRLWKLSPEEKVEDALTDLVIAIDMAQNAAYTLEHEMENIE